MKIADFKHRVILCSGYDMNLNEREVVMARFAAEEAWAKIDPVRGSLTVRGQVTQEGHHIHSHIIFIRFSPMVEISGFAWIFEERKLSGSRWWKIHSVREEEDNGRYWRFEARLHERGTDSKPAPGGADDAPKPGVFNPVPLR